MDSVTFAIMILGFVIVLLFAIETLYEYFREERARQCQKKCYKLQRLAVGKYWGKTVTLSRFLMENNMPERQRIMLTPARNPISFVISFCSAR